MFNLNPIPNNFTGLSQQALRFCQAFSRIAQEINAPGFTDADWTPIEDLIDLKKFVRQGCFETAVSVTIDWLTYKNYIFSRMIGTECEFVLGRMTETTGLVHLEMDVQMTQAGVTGFSKSLLIFEFTPTGKLCKLEAYSKPNENRRSAP